MLKIRLQRVGRKHDPSYRIVLTDSKNGPGSGKFNEILGNYDPKKNVRVVDGERVKTLISQGAQVSDTVYNILISEKVIAGKKKNVLPSKSPVVDETKIKAEEEARKAKEEAEAKARAEAQEAQKKAEEEEKAKAEAEALAEKEAVVEETPAVAETTETVETE